MRIQPARRLYGKLRMPGDKSISHRAALVAALASGGRSLIRNFSTSADCASTLSCLRQLGVNIRRDADDNVEIEGASLTLTQDALRAPSSPLDCGNSGSTMRMLAGVLAGQPFVSTLTGDESLRARPMRRIIEPLERMGARFASHEGRAPLRIEGRAPLEAIRYEMPVASAQVKSAILLAALGARGRTEIIERHGATRDHTERMLRWFGVNVETTSERLNSQHEMSDNLTNDAAQSFDVEHDADASRVAASPFDTDAASLVSVEGMQSYAARDVDVPGDISSAAFLIAAAALLPGSQLEIEGVGLNPTRAQILRTLGALGADVETSGVQERCHEAVGTLHVRGGRKLAPPDARSGAHVLSGAQIAQLIDELPVLAVVGSQVAGGLEIREAAELRFKESDRIRTTVENLRAMGAEVEELPDGLVVRGPVRLRGARLDAHGDHRIAMAFAVAALVAEGASEIAGAECVAVSFPEFFSLLESVTER
jgi:3-phosphoshikimate 1-carboxyvinyltransferase